jgi:hypothetical protein
MAVKYTRASARFSYLDRVPSQFLVSLSWIISTDISVLLKIYGYEYEYAKFSWNPDARVGIPVDCAHSHKCPSSSEIRLRTIISTACYSQTCGNRGFGSGERGVIQTSICLIDDCIGEMLETRRDPY